MNVAPQVDLKKVEYFIQKVGECEDQIFQKRARLLRRQKERRERDKQNGGRGGGRGRCGWFDATYIMVLTPLHFDKRHHDLFSSQDSRHARS